MDYGAGILVLVFVLFIFIYLIASVDSHIKKKLSEDNINAHTNVQARNYKLPKPAKVPENKHKAYDYWNDAGDGSGVNYVQMADGSVRID